MNCTSSFRVRAGIVRVSRDCLRLSFRLEPVRFESESGRVETIYRLLMSCCVASSRGPSPYRAKPPNIHYPRIWLPSSSFATTPPCRLRQDPICDLIEVSDRLALIYTLPTYSVSHTKNRSKYHAPSLFSYPDALQTRGPRPSVANS